MPRIPLKAALMTQGNTAALKDGRIRLPDFHLQFEEVRLISKAFRQMVRSSAYDVSEMAITTYLCARALGAQMTALPIFLTRGFHHRAMVCRPGIAQPKDLEGQIVAVNRGYTVTTSVWARAILAKEYGVDLSAVHWMRTGEEHVPDWIAPPNVGGFPAGVSIEDRLINDHAVAATGITEAPGTRPLIASPMRAAMAALRDRGFYPLNHVLVVRDDVLAAHPDLPAQLFHAFAAAKQGHVAALKSGKVAQDQPTDTVFRAVMEVLDDPLPYGIAPNAAMLDMLVNAAVAQGIIPTAMPIENLFAPSVRELVG